MIDIIRWCTQSQHTLSTHTREIHVEADRTREVKLMIADSIRIIFTQAIGSLVGWRSNVTIRLTESVVCNWYAHYANIFQSICIVFIQTWRHIVHSAYQSQWWEVSFSGGLLTYFTHHCPVIFCFFFSAGLWFWQMSNQRRCDDVRKRPHVACGGLSTTNTELYCIRMGQCSDRYESAITHG